MSTRTKPSFLRATAARLAVGGAAGLATVLAIAPVAVADDTPPDTTGVDAASSTEATPPPIETTPPSETTPAPTEATPTPTETTPAPTETTPAPTETTPAPTETTPPAQIKAPTVSAAKTMTSKSASKAVVTADFGGGKYRVGAKIADGSYVPAGTTTTGSTFLITQTELDGTVTKFSCTTTGPGPTTYCPDFNAPTGATISAIQTSAAPGLVAPTESLSPTCVSDEIQLCTIVGYDATFPDRGSILPVTSPDKASTVEGKSVTIDVLGNDDSEDPNTGLAIATDPKHGKAKVIGTAAPVPTAAVTAKVVVGAGSLKIRYTPAPGFSGTDTFTYAVSNSNGSVTGSVTVRVHQAPVVADDDDDADTVANQILPDTGGVNVRLLSFAGALIAGGGALIAGGRRRPKPDASIG